MRLCPLLPVVKRKIFVHRWDHASSVRSCLHEGWIPRYNLDHRFCLTCVACPVTLRGSMKRSEGSGKAHRQKTPSHRVIKKYSDRRLYDSSTSRYVTLEDVARMVREGVQLRVVDAQSGRDLTYVTLTQIILENAREREIPLPLHMLEQLVRASDKATHEFLSWYLSSTLDLYQKAQAALRTRLPEAKAVVTRPVEFVRSLLAGHPWPPPAPTADAGQVERLRREIDELRARLAGKDKPQHRTRAKRTAHTVRD